MSVLLTVEKTNELLLKNHDLRPIGSRAVLEAHTNAQKSSGPSKGYGRKQDKYFRRGGSRSYPYNRNNSRKQNHDIGQKPTRKQNDICYRYGLSGH